MDTRENELEYYHGLLDLQVPDGVQVLIIGTSWACPFSKRAEIALALKGVSYRNLIRPHDDGHQLCNFPRLQSLQYHIHDNIPVLVHCNRRLISESQIIIQYIDETWSSSSGFSILPRDLNKRAEARFWAKFIDEQCVPSLCASFWAPGENERNEAAEISHRNLRTLEAELGAGNKRFFGGENLGYVDIVAGFIGHWLVAMQEAAGMYILTEEAFPLLCRWRLEFLSCRCVRDKLPPRKRLVAFYWIRMEAAKLSRTP